MTKNFQIGSSAYYERLYEVEEEHWWYRGVQEAAARILDTHYHGANGLHILDAGCGTGFTLTWLEQYSQPRKAVGIDLSSEAFPFCRRRGRDLLSRCSVVNLPFGNSSFDLIFCKAVIQHLPRNGSDAAALKEFYRVLKPGGCLFLITNSKLYRLDEIREKVEGTGFHILKLTYTNILGAFIDRLKSGGDGQSTGVSLPHRRQSLKWLNTLLAFVMKGEAWFLSKPSRTFSFGNSILVLSRRVESSQSVQQLSN
jgi:ubiquinone/menaquinone biosynthesis C-methylase UbiE